MTKSGILTMNPTSNQFEMLGLQTLCIQNMTLPFPVVAFNL